MKIWSPKSHLETIVTSLLVQCEHTVYAIFDLLDYFLLWNAVCWWIIYACKISQVLTWIKISLLCARVLFFLFCSRALPKRPWFEKKKKKKKKELEPAAVLIEQTASLLTPWCSDEWSSFWFHKTLSVTAIRLSKGLLKPGLWQTCCSPEHSLSQSLPFNEDPPLLIESSCTPINSCS